MTLHIVFGDSAGGSVRQALELAGRDDTVARYIDDLSFGPINPATPNHRAEWCERELYFPDDRQRLKDATDRFWLAVRSVRQRVVWYSRRTALEFCGFLEFISQMGRSSYSVVDLTDVEIPIRDHPDRRVIAPLALLPPQTIREHALWDLAAPLGTDDRRRFLQNWRRLRRQNAPFRIIDGDAVLSAPIDIHDEALLSHATAEWRRAVYVIGETMGALLEVPQRRTGDLVLFGRLRRLIDAGKLEARGDLATMRDTEVRLHEAHSAATVS